MGRFFRKNATGPDEKQSLVALYNMARISILTTVIFTLVNIVMALVDSSFYFLYSALVPYIIVIIGMVLCGWFPPEFYVGEWSDFIIFDKSATFIFVAVALVILALYVLAFIFSKKNKIGWIIFALVFFSLDTIFMFFYYGFTADVIVDLIFHVLIIVNLAQGIRAYVQIKKLPPEEETPAATEQDFNANEELPDSTPIRVADKEVKHRVLLEYDAFGHKIIYRRVKRVNELVIDDNVYAEYVALFEKPHMLTANLGGHAYAVGLDATSKSYILIDGFVAKERIRWG